MIGCFALLAAAVAFEQPHVVPTPATADWQLDQCVELKPELQVSMSVMDSHQREACADWFRRHAKAAFGVDWKVAFLARSTSTIGAAIALGEYSSAFPCDSVWEFSDKLPQFGMRRICRAEALKIAFAMSMWGRSAKPNNGHGLICDVMYDIKYCSYLRFFQTPRIPGRPLLADPTPSKIYAVDCVGISYVLRERPEGLNVEHNGDARLEYAGIDVDCRGARKMTLDQVLQHILDVGGHYCEDEPDEGGI